MREIKFRAWWKTQSIMAPVYDLKYDFYNPQENMPSTKTLILKTLSIDTHSTYPYKDFLNHGKIGWNNPNMMIDVEECVLMQYTGLNDKNGKEIYEGDVLTFGDRNYSLHYGLHATWVMSIVPLGNWELGRGPFIFLWQNYSESEVIGNIYENPELLTTKETQQ